MSMAGIERFRVKPEWRPTEEQKARAEAMVKVMAQYTGTERVRPKGD